MYGGYTTLMFFFPHSFTYSFVYVHVVRVSMDGVINSFLISHSLRTVLVFLQSFSHAHAYLQPHQARKTLSLQFFSSFFVA